MARQALAGPPTRDFSAPATGRRIAVTSTPCRRSPGRAWVEIRRGSRPAHGYRTARAALSGRRPGGERAHVRPVERERVASRVHRAL